MKKTLHIISIVVQYIIAVCFAIITLGAFTSSVASGLMMLIATLLACPFTRNKGYSFIQNKFKIPMDKIKGWIIIPISVLFIAAVSSDTTTENTANNQVAEMESMVVSLEAEMAEIENVVESTPISNEQVESAETPSENIAESIETEEGVASTEIIAPTESIIEETVELPTVSDMEVHYIDVGQGDATLVKADDHYMLIDAGDNSKGTTVQLYLQKQGVEKLDYLILTHTDADHIGGADVIVNKFDIDTVFLGDFKKDNDTYEDLMNAFSYKGLTYSIPSVGSEYQLGNAMFTIVAPNSTYDNPNDSSIALVLKNGDNSFIFTGDCEEQAENDILSNGLSIDCDVYKVGHHGSKTSSSQAFLNAITPIYGVISCEEGNSYGHPHAEPLNNLRAMGVQMFRTDEQGSIIAYSDGTEITWNCAPTESWKVGESTELAETPTPEPVVVPENEPAEDVEEEPVVEQPAQKEGVIGNKNSKAFHRPTCSRLPKEKNRVYFDSRDEALAAGYHNPCDYCDP